MDLIKSFVIDGTSYEVETVWENNIPLYRATDIGKVLGIKNIYMALQNIPEDEKVIRKSETLGGVQNVVYLVEEAAYLIVMRSTKPIAQPFRRWLASVAKTIREKGRYELECRLEDQKKIIEEKENYIEDQKNRMEYLETSMKNEALRFRVECSKNKHDSLVEANRKKTPVVYFGRVFTENEDESLIKIGRTDDVYLRSYGLVAEYGSFHYIEIFQCSANEEMESFLHTHHNIRSHAVSGLNGNQKKYKELYKFTEKELNTALDIARRNLHKFDISRKRQNKKDDLRQEMKIIQNFISQHIIKNENTNDESLPSENIESQTSQNIYNQEERQQNSETCYIIEDTHNYSNYKIGRGNKVQRYSPDGTTLLHTYNGFLEAERDTDLDSPVSSVIRLAAKNRTVYKGFRWAELDRSLDDTTHQDIGKTVGASTQRKGFVAMLHIDGSHIVRVFSDQKEAAKDRNFKSCAPVCMAIQKGSVSGGHRFRMWYDCSDELKKKFFENGGQLPAPTVRSHALQVEQLHAITGEVLRTFSSAAHVIKEYPMSRASLMQAIEGNLIKKGYKWRLLKKDDNEDQN